jgi:uncharacterized protein YggU (UPF0235/DUF167 family)
MKARIAIKVRTGAPKTEFTGRLGDLWKLHVAAPPVDGKANAAIVRYIARLAAVPARAVRIVTGLAATGKLVEIDGVSQQSLERAILETHGSGSHSGSAAPPKA